MDILIAGGTGLIGRKLAQQLILKGNRVFILSRKELHNSGEMLKFIQWNGKEIPETSYQFDVLINLTGEGVMDKSWTLERKKQIIESRTSSTFAFVDYINSAKKKPEVFINASAVGYYGERGDEVLTEESPLGKGFLAEVSDQWEKAASFSSIRTVLLRTGIVLANEGGFFKEIMRSYGFGFASWFGTGKQGFPWIHIDDEIGLILFAIENEKVNGAINLSAPELLSNKEFIKKLCNVPGKRIAVSAPSFALEIALGERAQVLLVSQFVKPEKALVLGYKFKFPDAESAIKNLLIL